MSVAIDLSPEDHAHAVKLGTTRNGESERAGLVPSNGYPAFWHGNSGTVHVMGACGEVAVARFLRLPLPASVNTFHAPDLVIPIQVRTRPNTTPREKSDHLIVRPSDPPEHIYVLVYNQGTHCELVGWIRGEDARREEWVFGFGNRPNAYFVPPAALHPMSTLLGEEEMPW